MEFDCLGLDHRRINEKIRWAISKGKERIILTNVNGQRYIASGLKAKVRINIQGTAGNDLAAFMDGPVIEVKGNAQDAIGNTMNQGKVVVRGSAGDVLGYGMRGGRLYILGDVGYRVGIHMKAYKNLLPVLIAGGTAKDYLGEYMAGGIIILLGLITNRSIVGNYVGCGMHGGVIYIRGKVKKYQLGREIGTRRWTEVDDKILDKYLGEYCHDFNLNFKKIRKKKFTRLAPVSYRPYGKFYAY